MQKFTFKVTKLAPAGFHIVVRFGAQELFSNFYNVAARSAALREARIDAEAYGYIDE